MLEPIENQYKKIGHIARSHGVQGDVLIIPDIYAPTLFEYIDLVRIQSTRGDLFPARVESVRVQEKNNRLSFFVKFEHVTDRSQAEELKQLPVFADRRQIEALLREDEESIDLSSFEILAGDDYFGTVRAVLENPAHPILEVISEEQQQLLIPLVDEYIVEINEEAQQIRCKNLDQLIGI